MIAEYILENFRSIKGKQVLSFEPTSNTDDENFLIEVKDGTKLLKIASIYGANASGKTNILLGLSSFRDLMTDIKKDELEEIDYQPFAFDKESLSEPTKMSLSFYINSEKYILNIEYDNNIIFKEELIFYADRQPAKLYFREYNKETEFTNINFGNKLELNKKGQNTIIANTIKNTSVIATMGKLNLECPRLKKVFNYFAVNFAPLLTPKHFLSDYSIDNIKDDKDGSLKRFIVKLLKMSDFNISDLEVKEEDIPIDPEMIKFIKSSPMPEKEKEAVINKGSYTTSEVIFKHKVKNGEYSLSEGYESAGTDRYLGMAIILYKLLHKNRIICIDEVESSLHYELLLYFIKLFLFNGEKESQLILSTHDINLLDEDFFRRDTIWFTDKMEDGDTLLSRLSTMGLHRNLSPYNAYRQGKLSNIPAFGDINLDLEEEEE